MTFLRLHRDTEKASPSVDAWLKEAKADMAAADVGMFLIHNGVVRQTAKAKVRNGIDPGHQVVGMDFRYDAHQVDEAMKEAYQKEGITFLRVWLNEGSLLVGDDIMYILIGGDIRPRVIDALQFLIEKIKTECVAEVEKF